MLALLSHSFPQLLERPVRSRVRSHIHVPQPACLVLDHNEDVQHPERGGDSHEEVTRDNGLGVVSEKRRPALTATRPASAHAR
jgi:hypothetical protein